MEVQKKEIDYGVLNTVSKEINLVLLGDDSGRTVSRRTTHGFKDVFSLSDSDISDENAEHIMHGAMITSALLVASKKKGAVLGGVILLACLVAFYQAGK